MSYKAIVCKIQNVRDHPNADRINLATIYGSQVVIGKEIKENDLGCYFPSDGALSSIFCKANNLYRHSDLNDDPDKQGFFDDNRRVRTQPFRHEKSDGFWIPISAFDFIPNHNLQEGDQFESVKGIEICQKYISKKTRAAGSGRKSEKKAKKNYPMLKEHVDTSQFMYNAHAIRKGSVVSISLKVHGTSARTSYSKVKPPLGFFGNILNKIFKSYENLWEYVTGTRRVVLDNFEDEKKLGFYGTNEFRKVYHDKIKSIGLKKGETIYYEIVGWVGGETLIMGRGKNKKLGKEFVEQYGDETIFKYGCLQGCSDIYVYRINMTNENGDSVEYSDQMMRHRCDELGLKSVPLIERFIYDGDKEALIKRVEALTEGPDLIDPSHIREGVVLRIEDDMNFYALKNKGYLFKVLEGIIKDTNVVDIEEAS